MVETADKVVAVDGKSDEATEIRCQKKSHGGLSYEVILAEPAPNVAVPKHPIIPGKSVSAEEIEQKLKAAEERRVSLEQKKMADLTNRLAKIKAATRKEDEIVNEFINQTKEQLESKMEHHVEKREAIISDLMEKLKIQSQEMVKSCEQLEQQKISDKVTIEEKLKSAQSFRDDYIKNMLERLKEHNTNKISEIKNQIDQLESQKIEKKTRIRENKLYTTKKNREMELKKKIEKVQQLERRAELFRQNKAAQQPLTDENFEPITSSN